MSLIYRIETRKGNLGPFTFPVTSRWKDCLPEDLIWKVDRNKPTPDGEGLNRTSDHKCGFSSLSQLKAWFPYDARNIMKHKANLVVNVYKDTPYCDIQKTKHQVIFLKKYTVKVKTLDLETFEELLEGG